MGGWETRRDEGGGGAGIEVGSRGWTANIFLIYESGVRSEIGDEGES